jgi:hypothetical protein
VLATLQTAVADLDVIPAYPRLRVTRVEGATHAMVAERPAEIARLITHFAAPAVA